MNISSTINAAKSGLEPGNILIVTVEQLQDFAVTVIQGIQPADEVIDIKELAKMLKVSESHAYKMAMNGDVPKLQMSPIRFSRSEIFEYLKQKV